MPYGRVMQSDSDIDSAGLASMAPTPAARHPLRRAAWLLLAALAVLLVLVLVWAARNVETSRALAEVEKSVAGVPPPVASSAGVPVPEASNVQAPVPTPVADAAVMAVAPADRLPPLPLAQAPQRAPDAVLRDLPEWLAAEVGGGVTSGSSGDESAAPAEKPRRRVERAAASSVQPERYGKVFARCPRPGESGAVECRRTVCSGGARRAAACAPYKE